MKPGTQADIVKEFGCSRTAISKLVKAKDYRIIYTPSGKINIDATVKALKDSGFGKRSKPLKKSVVKKLFTTENATPPTSEEIEEDLQKEGPLKVTDSMERINRHLSFQKAEKERIANEKAEKKLVDFNDTKDAVFNFLRPFRDDILDIGKRVAPIAYQAGSKIKAQKAIEDEIERIFKSRVGNEYKFDDELKKKITEILLMSLQRR